MDVLVLDKSNGMDSSTMYGRIARVGTTEEKFISEGKEVKGVHV